MQPTNELVTALESLKKLEGEDMTAVSSWLRAEGRAKLRDRGATDQQIGPMRLDIDKMGDAPLG